MYGTASTPYYTVEEAARILRMNPHTIYRNLADVPHIRSGTLIRIPCDFLLMNPPPVRVFGRIYQAPTWWQDVLPFDVKPERRWRNNHRLVRHDPFGDAL